MLVISLLVIVIACVAVFYYINAMKNQNLDEYKQVEDLKRRIDELDDDNVEVDSKKGTAKIIVPDSVDAKESTRISTQKEECKEYEVGPKQKIEKTVVGTNKKDEVFENSEIERVEDEKADNDDPIKENNGIISKILKNNDEE